MPKKKEIRIGKVSIDCESLFDCKNVNRLLILCDSINLKCFYFEECIMDELTKNVLLNS